MTMSSMRLIGSTWMVAGALACGSHEGDLGPGASPQGAAGATGSTGDEGVSGIAGAPATNDAAASDAVNGDASGDGNAGHSAAAGPPAGICDPGTKTTSWATSCPTAPPTTCVPGTWRAVGPDMANNDATLVAESAHFAVYSNGAITTADGNAATDELETAIWPSLFGSPIFFPEPYCNSSTKSKASIVVKSNFGLTGGGFGNGFMGMWVGPGATIDHWGLAHEFMHAVQSTTRGLQCPGLPSANATCAWFYEAHANWRAQQLDEFHTSAVHCSEMLVNAPHLYLGSSRDRYCNWQFLEYLKDRYCYQAVNDIWTTSATSADPFTNMESSRRWTTSQLNDFFGEWAMHNVTWDYRDPPPSATAGRNQGTLFRSPFRDFLHGGYDALASTAPPERRLRTAKLEVLDAASRRYSVSPLQAPQRWGYNIVRLYPDAAATSVTVTFRGVLQSAANSDWRWGLLATDAAITEPRYSTLQHGSDGELTFCVDPGESLWLVVTATPSVQQHIVTDQLYPTIYRYPYMVEFAHAEPEGYQPGASTPSPTGMRWANGGGWVASGASVASGAFVGPMAAVLGGTVGAAARIEDHAVIMTGSTVTSGTVGGLTILLNGMTVGDRARVALSWPHGPGWYEKPVSASGTAQLIGDIEYRGVNLNKASGTYCGFVDSSVNDNCSTPDVTVPPPYTWRP